MVVGFYELAFNQHKPAEAVARYIGAQYIQHSPFVPDGAQAFASDFMGYFKEHPRAHVKIRRVLSMGDLVMLYLNFKADDNDRGKAIVDIFRVEKGKFVEHWDVTQDVPKRTASGNTMFWCRAGRLSVCAFAEQLQEETPGVCRR